VAPEPVKIRWTEQAANDLQSVHTYLNERNPAAADATVDRILSGIDILEQFPQLGRIGRIEGTKELVIGRTPFIVMYRLHREQVEVLGVLHGARRWPKSF
jgi:addiction module RelE/StbE family toxin